jgi:hypothetical protein
MSDVNTSFIFPYRIGDEQKCITDTEKELRFLINSIMSDNFGASWLPNPSALKADVYRKLIETQQLEAKTLRNNAVMAASPFEYCYIRDLKDIIDKHWEKGFHEIFPSKRRTLEMLQILSEFRNPQMHGRRILFLYQQHLCLGIAGEMLWIVEQWRMGFKHKVKSYQCVFRFKPPNKSGVSVSELMTREEFIQRTSDWVDRLKATASGSEDKSTKKEIVDFLRFTEGSVTISFSKEEDGTFSTEQWDHEWYTSLIIETDNLEVIDRIVKEADRPYWVFKINLKDKLDAANIKSRIKEKTGLDPTGWSIGYTNNVIDGQLFNYPIAKLNNAGVRLTLKDEGQIEIVFDGSYGNGFYQAHNFLGYGVIILLLYGEYTEVRKYQLIKDACSKPSA